MIEITAAGGLLTFLGFLLLLPSLLIGGAIYYAYKLINKQIKQ